MKFQFPIPTVGPLRQQGGLQSRGLAGIDKVERRHGRIGGHAQGAPRAALLGDGQGRGSVGLLPAVVDLLVGAVAAYVGQELVEVLL